MVSLFGSHKSNLIMTCFFLVSISNYKRLPYTIQPPFKYRGSIKKREQWTHEAHMLLYDNPACKLLWSFCKLHHCFFDTEWHIFHISRFRFRLHKTTCEIFLQHLWQCHNWFTWSFLSICDTQIPHIKVPGKSKKKRSCSQSSCNICDGRRLSWTLLENIP